MFSPVHLDYPQNAKVTVWLKDANVPYFQTLHLFLAVITSLVLVLFFIPYTLLLLLGHYLYRVSGKRLVQIVIRIKPILDSYYAPFNKHSRYWTGFLLVVRCVLYIVFSHSSIGATHRSFLAIIITFTAILIVAWLSVKIYQSYIVNLIEIVTYFNLIILSSTALAGVDSPPLTYSLVALVFATMIGIIVYHFHILYIAKSALWAKFTSCGLLAKLKTYLSGKRGTTVAAATSQIAQNRHTSRMPLREPLMESS